MKVGNYTSLTEMIRKAEISPETVRQFRSSAIEAVDHAVDIFFKPEREVAQGREAYDNLTDVESALRAYKDRLGKDVSQTNAKAQAALEALSGGHEAGRSNVENEPSALPNGKPIAKGFRDYGYANKTYGVGNLRAESVGESKITDLVQKMGKILPLYGSVAMVPGPLSLSLKNHLMETLEWKFKGDSHSQRNVEQDSFRLLTLSAAKRTVHESSGGSTSGEGKVETVTVDERVLPGLHEIRGAIDGIRYVAPETGEVACKQEVKEYETTYKEEGVLFWKEQVAHHALVNSGTIDYGKAEPQVVPPTLRLGSAASNDGLAARPGSDLVDLVSSATLNEDFVDAFRGRARQVLDGAIETLFKTDREVADGRKAYDELTNLGRALTLAGARFGDNHGLGAQLKNIKEVTPLYACVAMVPGEMSSSVKNYAKELATYSISSNFGGSSTSEAISGSLLTLGMSQTTDRSSSSSNFNASGKFETITTDERIMPKLHELRVKLDQMQISTDYNGKSTLSISN